MWCSVHVTEVLYRIFAEIVKIPATAMKSSGIEDSGGDARPGWAHNEVKVEALTQGA